MLVGIITANNLRFSPYAFFYINILDNLKINYEVIVPNRNPKQNDTYEFKVRNFCWNQNQKSIINYYNYSNYAKKISVGRYDFLIVLTTINGVFCYHWLKKHFNEKYILDIRDYTYERFKLYYYFEKKVIKASKTTVISSPRFNIFLPKGNYLVAHNISTPKTMSEFKFEKKKGELIIGYIGAISYEQQCKKIIDLVNNDDRFRLHFYGTGIAEEKLKHYAQGTGNARICFFGAYKAEEKEEIIKKVDIIFNAYGNGVPLVDFALSNKLYDAIYYHKLLLTSPNTYMSEIGGPISCPLDMTDNNALNNLWEWYHQLDEELVNNYASNLYSIVLKENISVEKQIKNIFKRYNEK